MAWGWLLLLLGAVIFLYGYWIVRGTEPETLGESIHEAITGSRVGFGIFASTITGVTLIAAQLLGFGLGGLPALDPNIWTAIVAIGIAILQGLGLTSFDPGLVLFGLFVVFIAIGLINELWEGGS